MGHFNAWSALPKGGCLAEKRGIEPSWTSWTHSATVCKAPGEMQMKAAAAIFYSPYFLVDLVITCLVLSPFDLFPFVAVFLPDPPDWVPDEVCSYCTACKAPFTVIRRKHHCRSCGKVMTHSGLWGAPTKASSKFMCTTEPGCTAKRARSARGLSSQVLLCAWAASSQLMFTKGQGGVWLLYSNKCIKLKAEFPDEILEHSPPQQRHSGLLL